MAFTFSNVRGEKVGAQRMLSADFTSASGDQTMTFESGLSFISMANVSLQKGGIDTPRPKVTWSDGTVTAVFDDTLGYSGTVSIMGRQ